MKASDYAMLAEARILEAQARGDLDALPGKGKALPPDELAGLPADQRAHARIQGMVGAVPDEIRLKREIEALRERLRAAEPDGQAVLRRQIADLQIRLDVLYELSGRPLLANPGLCFLPR